LSKNVLVTVYYNHYQVHTQQWGAWTSLTAAAALHHSTFTRDELADQDRLGNPAHAKITVATKFTQSMQSPPVIMSGIMKPVTSVAMVACGKKDMLLN
jgi:hypothetical protein